MSSPNGLFLTLEGTEGAGKSTNVFRVCQTLDHARIPYIRTREPGGTEMAEEIRECMLRSRQESVAGLTELLLVFAARTQHLETVIKPALAEGKWVVCDRFTDATFAYQGFGRNLNLAQITTLEGWVQGDLQPDLTLFLDVDPVLSMERIRGRQLDRMEQEEMDFFNRVRNGYLRRAKQFPRFKIVDASRSIEAVQQDVQSIVELRVTHWLKAQKSASQDTE